MSDTSLEANDTTMDANLVRDFINRYEQGDPTQGYSEDEALTAFARATRLAPPEVLRRASDQAIERLDQDQRAEFNQLMRSRNQPPPADPDTGGTGLETIFSGLFGADGLGGMFQQGTSAGQNDHRGESPANPLGNLGPLLASPVGRAVIGGIGAFALKAMIRGRH